MVLILCSKGIHLPVNDILQKARGKIKRKEGVEVNENEPKRTVPLGSGYWLLRPFTADTPGGQFLGALQHTWADLPGGYP